MSIAILIQTPNAVEGNDQTLLVPNRLKGRVDIYHRTSTGKRGRSESWRLTSLDTLPNTDVEQTPVAIRLSSGDEQAIAVGTVTAIAVKAVNALENATPFSGTDTHAAIAADYAERLAAGDSDLCNLLVDKRLANKSLNLKPLVAQTERVSEQVTKQLVGASSGPRVEMATVPDLKWADQYIQRKVVGNLTEFDVFDIALANHQNVLIKGHAGSGKTMAALAYAASRGIRYYNVSSHIGVEASQLFGKWNPNEDGHFHWQDGPVTDIVRNGGFLLLNEVNFLPERVTTVLFSLLDDRREIQLMDKDGEVIKAHPDLLIVADMNPNYRGTRELNQAWNDRFAHHLEFPYDPEIEKRLIPNKAIRELAAQLRESFDRDEISTPISTRGLVALTRNIENLGLDYALYSYINTFPAREQAALSKVFETHQANIMLELGLDVATVTNDEVALTDVSLDEQVAAGTLSENELDVFVELMNTLNGTSTNGSL